MTTGLLAYRWDVGNGSRFARVAFTPIVNGAGQVIPWGGVALGTRLR